MIVNIGNKKIPMIEGYGIDLELGDDVRTHHGYVIGKIDFLGGLDIGN